MNNNIPKPIRRAMMAILMMIVLPMVASMLVFSFMYMLQFSMKPMQVGSVITGIVAAVVNLFIMIADED